MKKNNSFNKGAQYPEYLVKEVNNGLLYYINKYKDIPLILKRTMGYTIKNGGKRFRPILCLLVAISLGKDYRILLPTACAIEFIHTYSLIHDDLPPIDNDDFRRGKPSCHKKFGEDMAILTGDALFAEAFNIILKYQFADDNIKVKVLKEISDATGAEGMAGGQVVDVYYTGKKITRKKLENMDRNKTGKLITASIRCGAILCKVNEGYLDKFTEYSENIGLAFQITDDILDIESGKSLTGKTSGKDKIQGKNTYPYMWGIEKSKKMALDRVNEAISIVESMSINYEWFVNIAKFIILRKA